MRVGKKIITGFVIIGFVITLIGLIAVRSIHVGVEELGSFHTPNLYSIQSMQVIVTEAVQYGFAYLASGEKMNKEEFFKCLEKFDAEVEAFRKIAALDEVGEEEERAIFETILSYKKDLAKLGTKMFHEYETHGSVSRETIRGFEDVGDKTTLELAKLVKVEKEEVEESHLLAVVTIKKAEWLIYSIGILAIVISLVIGGYISRTITRPIRTLQDAATAVGQGKLDTTIDVPGRDEIGELAAEFNQMTAKLAASQQHLHRAKEQVQLSLNEKEVLLKEIHHRVKNNLQIISSLLGLQAESVKDHQTIEMLNESQNRVTSIALTHKLLYQSADLGRIDLGEYIRNLADVLFDSYAANSEAITFKINAEDVFLDIDTAIHCGLIVNELISNSLKHGFPPLSGADDTSEVDKGEICIDVSERDGTLGLRVSDNGIGFPADLDFRQSTTLGLQLVCTLTDQLGGAIELDRSRGTTFTVRLPKHSWN